MGCKMPVFKVNPGAIKLAMETDSPILHSKLKALTVDDPPPLLIMALETTWPLDFIDRIHIIKIINKCLLSKFIKIQFLNLKG
jgi:hypothetical protein